ncbi:helix-turn-helix domain-containing protein [Streptomyces chartreusis]|uniref:helix-turn-helix domain-containing protein n=1 Tax=Streptomyces chartreusis TaxID=1969 RepID=UPI003666364B
MHLGDKEGLDRGRRYLRPVARLQLPDEPDLVHLAMYEWLPMFEAWATGPALCGRSTSQGPLPEGTEVTCRSCVDYQPKYQTALDLQAGLRRVPPVSGASAQERLLQQVQMAVKGAGLKRRWIAERLHVSDKHLSQLLTGRASMTLNWAEQILRVCGLELVVKVRPQDGGHL